MKRLFLFSAGGLAALVGVVFAVGVLHSPDFHAEASVEIARPSQQVYEFLINAENLPKWSPEIEKVAKVSDEPLRFQVSSRGASNVVEYFDRQPPRTFSSRTSMPEMGLSGTWRIRIEPSAAGCRVTSTVDMKIESARWRAIAQFMDASGEEQKTLAALKQYLEK
ncbi:MAG: SRPBCC family protein [Acidobacteria bacterium]|nr:SRPBCC family protein [Acidobacteriota bacterium]